MLQGGPLGRSKPDLPTYCIGCHGGQQTPYLARSRNPGWDSKARWQVGRVQGGSFRVGVPDSQSLVGLCVSRLPVTRSIGRLSQPATYDTLSLFFSSTPLAPRVKEAAKAAFAPLERSADEGCGCNTLRRGAHTASGYKIRRPGHSSQLTSFSREAPPGATRDHIRLARPGR